LSPPARCLLLELKALYNGRNNGELFLSVREAARRLGIGKTLAAKCFRELCDRGFIKIAKQGAFNVKAESRRGDATGLVAHRASACGRCRRWQSGIHAVASAIVIAGNELDGSPERTRCPAGGLSSAERLFDVRSVLEGGQLMFTRVC
jgi:hypothetical protein